MSAEKAPVSPVAMEIGAEGQENGDTGCLLCDMGEVPQPGEGPECARCHRPVHTDGCGVCVGAMWLCLCCAGEDSQQEESSRDIVNDVVENVGENHSVEDSIVTLNGESSAAGGSGRAEAATTEEDFSMMMDDGLDESMLNVTMNSNDSGQAPNCDGQAVVAGCSKQVGEEAASCSRQQAAHVPQAASSSRQPPPHSGGQPPARGGRPPARPAQVANHSVSVRASDYWRLRQSAERHLQQLEEELHQRGRELRDARHDYAQARSRRHRAQVAWNMAKNVLDTLKRLNK